MWSARCLFFSETNRKQITDFRGMQNAHLSVQWWTYFPQIVPKIRHELKLITVDFVLGGQNRILDYCRFHQFLNDYARNSLPDITKICVRLRYVISQSTIVSVTNRKQISDFRGVRIPIQEVSRLQLPPFLRTLAVSRLHLIDPSSIENNIACWIVCEMHLIDNHFGFCLSVCVCLSTDRLSNDYVRNSLPIFNKFCTDRHKKPN